MISEFAQGVFVTLGIEAAVVVVLMIRGHLRIWRSPDDGDDS